MRNRIFVLLLAICTGFSALAQKADVLTEAENAYNNGQFLKVDSLLSKHVRTMSKDRRINAYRLLAMSALFQDNPTKADTYVQDLLNVDPYYSAYNESPRLADLINAHKQQEAGITTASRQAESLSEAPLPVTLITEDMIRLSGAQTLQELLTLFVPGMNLAEGMESNIAMHGISSITQSKILFLQDGHRLNSSSVQSEAPDFRNSLDKIKQVEILRGPASSLYGSVALTAVVNIITRKGAELNGGRISGTIGTQSTYGASYVVGGGNNVIDIMGWGSINKTDGFKHTVDNPLGGTTTLYSHGYRDRPSYDLGIKGRWKDFSLTFNSQRSKQSPYINILQLPATQYVYPDGNSYKLAPSTPDFDAVSNFNYDKYGSISSNKPGATRTNHHLNLDYNHTIGDITLSASGYLSMEKSQVYNAMGDSINKLLAYTLVKGMIATQGTASSATTGISSLWTQNVYQTMEWENLTLGGQLQLTGNYHLWGHGTGMVGAQYEHFLLTGSNLTLGGASANVASPISYSVNDIISKGNEDLIGVFAQIKHYLPGDKFIINAGLRYDHKNRFSGEHLDRVSPRISLIYKLNNAYTLLASYNYSLVDAPYIYRASVVNFFSGGTYMKPETMQSYQLGANWHQPNGKWQAEISMFYNDMDNLINRNSTMQNERLFQNAGAVKQIGVEGSVQYTAPRVLFNMNASWQRILQYEDYNVYNHETLGTPEFSVNATGAWAAYKGNGTGFFKGGKLWLRATAQLQSKTYYTTTDFISSYYKKELAYKLDEAAVQLIPSLGVSYEWKYLDMDLSLKNITNREYMIASLLSGAIPHDGRQLLFKLTFKF